MVSPCITHQSRDLAHWKTTHDALGWTSEPPSSLRSPSPQKRRGTGVDFVDAAVTMRKKEGARRLAVCFKGF
jgi:hypothetical protein